MISRIFNGYVVVALAVLALYARTAGFDFLCTDDPDYVFANPFVASGLSWANLKSAFSSFTHGAIWMPLTWLSYQLTITLFGPSPAAHHLVSVALHIANAFLLLRLLRELFPEGGCGRWSTRALSLAVMVWALHPQRVESVAWIASRKELIWTAFALLSLLAWRKGRPVAASCYCALACLSKPTAMVIPVLLMFFRPAAWSIRSAFLKAVPMFVMALLTGLVAVFSQTHPEGMGELALYYAPLWERSLNAVCAIGLYLAEMIIPVGIHLDYHYVRGLPHLWFIALPVFILFLLVVLRFGRHAAFRRVLIFFLLPLLPTLGILASFGEHARADRFLYLPAMALPVAIAAFGPALKPRRIFVCASVVIAAALFALSLSPLEAMRTSESAYTRTLAFEPENPIALGVIGERRCAAGKLDEGIEMLREARVKGPSRPADARYAYALMRRGRQSDHIEVASIFADYSPTLPKALEALGTAELIRGEWKAAAGHLAAAILSGERNYPAEDARLKLAYAWHNGGERENAKRLLAQLVRSSRPDIAERATSAYEMTVDDPAIVLFW